MEKQILIFCILLLFSLHKAAAQQYTSIPDSNFEKALIDLGIDSDSTINGQTLTSDISSVTDLNVTGHDIGSLAGIEDFGSLQTLNCSNNTLISLDLSNNSKLSDLNCSSNSLSILDVTPNKALEKLNCQDNLLTSLDVSKNLLLTDLDFTSNQIININTVQNDSLTSLKCSNNQLTSLFVNANDSLQELSCSNNQIASLILKSNRMLRTLLAGSNQLTTLDLNKNDSLNFLDVSNNQLTALDVSNNLLLTNITCPKNQLKTLDVTKNDSLTFLGVSNNQLKSIDLGNNKKLENFICASNQLNQLNVDSNLYLQSIDVSLNLITGLNFSGNDSLTSINVSTNQLSSLNIKNGYNSRISTFYATNNPNLLCITIDDTAAIGSIWKKDSIARYNEVCTSLTYIPDDRFEQALIDLGLDNSLDNYVPTANIDTLHVLNVSGKGIKVLTGIKDFVALTLLDCSNDSLSNLDVSFLANLVNLDCSSNELVDLNLKNISTAILTTLNASTNPLLTCIKVDNVAAANNAPGWKKDAVASYNLNCSANKTYIPDPNFEQALIDLGYDKGSLDNYVVTDSIKNIKVLDVSGKNITDLTGIEAFTLLDSLNCSSNKLTSLDVSNLDFLRKLSCLSNYLSGLDVTKNDSLRYLICGDNRLTSLDVTKNDSLLQLVCDANDLTTVDVSKNSKLLSLNCGSNNITNAGLDISSNSFLIQLICANNKLSSIDITNNAFLADFDCSNNNLQALDLSKNSFLLRLNCSLNNLSNLDIANNNYLADVECNSNQITSLDFTTNKYLWNLSCDNNQLNNLDITKNDSLRRLSVAGNKLQTLNLSKNFLLNYLKCNDNQLPTLVVTANDSLYYLSLAGNKILNLNTTNLRVLNYLNCDRNKIDSLDISKNKELTELHCAGNSIQGLALDSSKYLQVLDISKNNLNSIQLSAQDSLKSLTCSDNQMHTLALGNNKVLRLVTCSGNELTRINIQNGNNDSLITFTAMNNPDLTCIEVDDPNNIGSNWQKDSTASYSINCHYDETYVPDDNLEAALAVITGAVNNNDNYILTSSIDTLTFLDISNRNISDMTGIQDFTSLQILNVSHNNIDSLDLSKNNKLTNLNVSANMLDTLDLSQNTKLEILNISSNQLTVLNTDSLLSLTSLNAAHNQLTELNLSKDSALEFLNCATNQLANLRVNNANNASLITFDATQNPDLSCIEVDDPNTIPGGWKKDNTASYSKNCHYNETYVPDDAFEQALIDAGYDYAGVNSLDDYVPTNKIAYVKDLNLSKKGIKDLTGLEAFVNLVSLNIKNDSVAVLDISNNLKLEILNCSGNNLTSVDLTKNTSLKTLDCSSNLLTGLDVSNNIALSELTIDKNPITSIDLQKNINLKKLNCSYTNLLNLGLNKNINLQQLTANKNEVLLAVGVQSGNNAQLKNLDLQFNPVLNCILVDNRDSAYNNTNWLKDSTAGYRLICDDDDNDGVPNNEDQCPGTPFTDKVNLFGCSVFILPANNFTVLATDETCRSSDNGKINITANKTANYKATIEVDGKVLEYNFTNTVEIRDLRAGTYQLCLTINGQPTYRNCYTIVINQPIDLAVVHRMNTQQGELTLELSGGTHYEVVLNGKILNTSDSSIVLKLDKGLNKIKVGTGKVCQGMYEQEILFMEDLVYYPNPFSNQFTIFMGKEDSRKASVNIYSWLGQLVISKFMPVDNGTIKINAPNLPAGIYTVSVNTGTSQYTFKIVKK